MQDNPLLRPSALPYGLPEWNLIKPPHISEAIKEGMKQHRTEIDAIVSNPDRPTFDNTLVELEKSGLLFKRAKTILRTFCDAETTPELDSIDSECAPLIAAHNDAITFNEGLWKRVDAVNKDAQSQSQLNSEQQRLLYKRYKDFVRDGAALPPQEKKELGEINAELASLEITFAQKTRAERVKDSVIVDNVKLLEGLTESQIQAASQLAESAGHSGKYAIEIVNTTTQPVLSQLKNAEVRRRVLEVSEKRNSSGGPNDTRGIVARVITLRARKAKLLGYQHWADYVTELEAAQSARGVDELLAAVIPEALKQVQKEAEENQAVLTAEGAGTLTASDWDYCSAKVLQQKYSYSEAELSEYFELDNVLHNAVFWVAQKLYGITLKRREDLPTYNPDIRNYEVFDHDGTPIGFFILDPFSRECKKGGAWMDEIVQQCKLLDRKPVIINCLNVPKPPPGKPALMTLEWVNTAFHEFGHGLHGLLSNVTYPSIASISVSADFVEFPSQVNEMWKTHPEVLRNYARHHATGDLIPAELVQKVCDSKRFNEGYRTCAYLAATVIDQALHTLSADELPKEDEIMEFESSALERAKLKLPLVPPRYHTAYFAHLFTYEYSAKYYSYIWAEVLAASAEEWILAHGGLTRDNGDRLRSCVLSRGNTANPSEFIEAFLGGKPSVDALLRKRGFL